MFVLMGVAIVLVIAHEAAHVFTTMACGGQFEGVVVKHVVAVGVRIRVDGLSARQVAWTLWAAPVAESVVLLLALAVWPSLWLWWVVLGSAQWTLNLIPWPWFSNDGRKLWVLAHQGRQGLGASSSS